MCVCVCVSAGRWGAVRRTKSRPVTSASCAANERICCCDPVVPRVVRHGGKCSLKHASRPQDTVETFKEEEALLLGEVWLTPVGPD